MEISFHREDGRLIGRLDEHVVTASNPEAAGDLLSALDDAKLEGLGECFWHEQGGDYRWMLCRHGDTLDVAVMWCASVIVGWQHVFRADCGLVEFEGAVRAVDRGELTG